MELDESLPSQSTLTYGQTLRSSRYISSYPVLNEREDENSEDNEEPFYRPSRLENKRRSSPSPPPPPPPPMTESYLDDRPATTRTMTGLQQPQQQQQQQQHGGGNGNGLSHTKEKTPPKGPFPFLKRNSRKEPTALNRKPTSPVQTTTSSNYSWENANKESGTTSHNQNNHTSTSGGGTMTNNYGHSNGQPTTTGSNKNKIDMTATKSSTKPSVRDNSDGDVLLNGSDYWGLEGSVMQELQYITEKNTRGQSFLEDTLSSSSLSASTTSIGLHDWKKGGGSISQGLDEFQKLEMQQANVPPSRPLSSMTSARNGRDDDDGEEDELNQRIKTSSRPTSSASSTTSFATNGWGAVSQPKMLNRTYADSSATATTRTSNSNRMAATNVRGLSAATTSISTTREEETKIVRPSSTMRTSSRGISPAPRRSTSQPRGAKGKTSAHSLADQQLALDEKAKELEVELETYRAENSNLKKLRRQHETGLIELMQKKEELTKFCEDEKAKTLAWCEEQKAAAERERRQAAKQARDMRQKAGTMPIRKEKAELEALQATIEKMKVTHEAAAKKWKMAENRLYSLIKEHSAHIDQLDQQLLAAEEQKIMLLDFIAQNGLRLPKNIRAKVIKGASDAVLEKTEKGGTARKETWKGYVEEVDVEEVLAVAQGLKESRQSHSMTNRPTLASTTTSMTKSNHQTKLGNTEPIAMSWARSSRSSTRYSSSSFDDDLGDRDPLLADLPPKLEPKQEVTAQPQPHPSSSSFSSHIDNMPKGTQKVAETNFNKNVDNDVMPDGGDNGSNNRLEEMLPDGSRRIHYRNGTVKTIDKNGRSFVQFTNGDSKRSDPNSGVIVYYYAQADTTHTSYRDGLEVYEFPNGQVEKHYADGRKEVIFPDQTRKVIETDGIQESHFPDGVILREYPDGRKEVVSSN
eukprot:gene1633-1782_t